jgi:hypothetical protein
MHLPAYFLEIAALIFALAGACFGWLTRWHVLLAAAAGSGVLFVAQCVLHMLDDDTVTLLVLNGPAVFYAMISLLGMVPALIGAALARLVKRWRHL